MIVEISFGALSDPVGAQLKAQGLFATKDDIEHWEKDRKALARLRVRGLLPDATAHAAERRLMKKIVAGVRAASTAADSHSEAAK